MYEERPSRLSGAFVWTSTVDEVESRILPDGCMDLMWGDDGVLVAGPDTTAFLFEAAPGTRLIGLRFAPGCGPRVLGVPADEFTDRRVALDAVWPRHRVGRLEDELAASHDPGRTLEDVVMQGLRTVGASELIDAVVARVREGQDVPTIADAVTLSTRQLHRRCVEAFGYGAKTLMRILRMQRALDMTRSGVAFADAAASAGYSDQAHRARDVRGLTGVTLGQLVEGSAGNAANRSTVLPSGS